MPRQFASSLKQHSGQKSSGAGTALRFAPAVTAPPQPEVVVTGPANLELTDGQKKRAVGTPLILLGPPAYTTLGSRLPRAIEEDLGANRTGNIRRMRNV